MVITLVGQEYEFTESWHDYKTGTGTTFGGWEAPMDIRKSRDNFDENGKPRCFNCNVYEYIAKECRKPKKDKEMRKCYKCNKVRYLAKDCKLKQKIKIRRNQDESDESDNDNDKKESFIKGLE